MAVAISSQSSLAEAAVDLLSCHVSGRQLISLTDSPVGKLCRLLMFTLPIMGLSCVLKPTSGIDMVATLSLKCLPALNTKLRVRVLFLCI